MSMIESKKKWMSMTALGCIVKYSHFNQVATIEGATTKKKGGMYTKLV